MRIISSSIYNVTNIVDLICILSKIYYRLNVNSLYTYIYSMLRDRCKFISNTNHTRNKRFSKHFIYKMLILQDVIILPAADSQSRFQRFWHLSERILTLTRWGLRV